jgi:hypothetical protein
MTAEDALNAFEVKLKKFQLEFNAKLSEQLEEVDKAILI